MCLTFGIQVLTDDIMERIAIRHDGRVSCSTAKHRLCGKNLKLTT